MATSSRDVFTMPARHEEDILAGPIFVMDLASATLEDPIRLENEIPLSEMSFQPSEAQTWRLPPRAETAHSFGGAETDMGLRGVGMVSANEVENPPGVRASSGISNLLTAPKYSGEPEGFAMFKWRFERFLEFADSSKPRKYTEIEKVINEPYPKEMPGAWSMVCRVRKS